MEGSDLCLPQRETGMIMYESICMKLSVKTITETLYVNRKKVLSQTKKELKS
jgi:hypothetical protein